MKVLKVIEKIVLILCVIFLLWFLASFINVDVNNTIDGGELAPWNLFSILF